METISLNINGVCRELAVGKELDAVKDAEGRTQAHRNKMRL